MAEPPPSATASPWRTFGIASAAVFVIGPDTAPTREIALSGKSAPHLT